MIEVVDAGGRAMMRGPAAYYVAAGRIAETRGAARFYAAAPLYMTRPRTREAWRAREAARHIFRAEINFLPFFV